MAVNPAEAEFHERVRPHLLAPVAGLHTGKSDQRGILRPLSPVDIGFDERTRVEAMQGGQHLEVFVHHRVSLVDAGLGEAVYLEHGRRRAVELQRTAADGLRAEDREDEHPVWPPQSIRNA